MQPDKYTSLALTQTQVSNFWLKVSIGEPDECWEWKGSLKPQERNSQ